MRHLLAQIDEMEHMDVPPNELTRLTAKMQARCLLDFDKYHWTVSALKSGAIEFRRVTPVSTYLVTVHVT